MTGLDLYIPILTFVFAKRSSAGAEPWSPYHRLRQEFSWPPGRSGPAGQSFAGRGRSRVGTHPAPHSLPRLPLRHGALSARGRVDRHQRQRLLRRSPLARAADGVKVVPIKPFHCVTLSSSDAGGRRGTRLPGRLAPHFVSPEGPSLLRRAIVGGSLLSISSRLWNPAVAPLSGSTNHLSGNGSQILDFGLPSAYREAGCRLKRTVQGKYRFPQDDPRARPACRTISAHVPS